MKKALLVLLFCLKIGFLLAQTNGDYRSRADGYWTTTGSWEVYNNGWQILYSSAAGPFQNVIPSNTSGEITIRHTISIITNVFANQLVIQANARLNILTGRLLRIVDDLTTTPFTLDNDGILANSGTLDLQTSMISTPCQINGRLVSVSSILTSDPSLLFFNSGSIYQHANKSGGNIPLATWDLNSLCYVTGLTSNPTLPANLNQSFGNFLWNTSSLSNSSFSLEGQLTSVNGDLRFLNTGNAQLRLDDSDAGTILNVGGDLTIEGVNANVLLSQSQNSGTIITIGGDFILSAGTFTMGVTNNQPISMFIAGDFQKAGGAFARGSGTGVGTIVFDGAFQTFTNSGGSMTGAINYIVESGSNLNLGTSAVTGTGTFTLVSSGTIQVGSTDAGGAIQSSAISGNIRVSGTRSYQSGSTIIYNGLGPQFIGTGHPSTANTTINNTNNVRLVGNVTINGALSQPNGVLLIENYTLTLGGAYSRVNGYFGITTLSNLVINGSGNFGDLILSPSEFANNPMRNLIINRNGTVFLGNSLIVGGTYSQSIGNFSLGQFSSYTLTLRGNVVQSGGSVSVFQNTSLVIEGSGTLPANLNIVGPDLLTLTMDRVGRTFTSTSPMTITNLNLFNGIVNNPSFNITMANNGVVTRRSGGSITTPLGALSNFDVLYDVTTNIVTGNELPFDVPGTRLKNLTKLGTATVTLDHNIIVNESFMVNEGTFNIADLDVSIAQDLIVNATLLSTESKVSFIGSTPQVINNAKAVTLYDVEINQGSASTVTLLGDSLSIRNSLAVNSASAFNTGTNQLWLLSTPTQTANVNSLASGASIAGSVIVQRYLPKVIQRRQFHYMASPVINSTLADWGAELPISRAYRWNEPTQAWVQINTGTVVTNGGGFIVDVASNVSFTSDSRGTLAQGTINVPLSKQASTGSYQGMNLVGNPYPSAIDWDNITVPPNVDNAVYLVDNFGNSGQGTGTEIDVSYVDGVGTPIGYSGAIAQGQSFFVFTTANATLSFTEAAKITPTNTQFFKKGEIPNLLRITLSGNDVKDEAVIRLRDGASDKFDRQYDAYKLAKDKSNIGSLTSDNVKTVINALGTSECNKIIPLVTEVMQQGNYTLSFVGMESFDSFINMNLLDLVEKNTIDLKENKVYSFTVTEKNIDLISTRFQISIEGNSSPVNNTITAVGESICKDNSTAIITLETSELGVEYTAEWNGIKISEPVTGTGSLLKLTVNTSDLLIGANNVTVKAQSGVCSMTALSALPVITKINPGEIRIVQGGVVCGGGQASLIVSGATAEGWYQWYNSYDDKLPISGQSDAEYITPYLNKSKTYYVSAVNELGCEGARVPVNVVVTYPEEVSLTSAGSTLISSADAGNEWYLDGQLIKNATGNTWEAVEPGLYTVNVTNGGCSTSASLEILGEEGDVGITVFPNPTTSKVLIRVKTANNNVTATLVNTQGIEIGSKPLIGEGEIKEAEFDLLTYASGIYNVRVQDGRKVIIKKIAKVK